jgi:hypothetical protein
MKTKYVITLEGREDVINLRELDTTKLEEMIQIALEFENYEMCCIIQKIINNKLKKQKLWLTN